MKTCFLFTATTEKYMEDIMHILFNVKADQFIKYRLILNEVGQAICLLTYDYEVGEDSSHHWQIIEDKIRDKYQSSPIVVFVKAQSKVKNLKEIAIRNQLLFYDASTDAKLM